MSVLINAGALPIHTGFSNLSELLLKLELLAPGYPSCSSCSSDPRAGLKRAERAGGGASPLVLVAEGWAQAQSARTPQPAETRPPVNMETKYVATQLSDNPP